jgi:hypothetical protein
MDPLDAVKLTALMELTSGRPEVAIGLIDGPVASQHPDLAGSKIRAIPGKTTSTCRSPKSAACAHGTFVAGILSARRGSIAPAICPGCTLIVRPIFAESTNGSVPCCAHCMGPCLVDNPPSVCLSRCSRQCNTNCAKTCGSCTSSRQCCNYLGHCRTEPC